MLPTLKILMVVQAVKVSFRRHWLRGRGRGVPRGSRSLLNVILVFGEFGVVCVAVDELGGGVGCRAAGHGANDVALADRAGTAASG